MANRKEETRNQGVERDCKRVDEDRVEEMFGKILERLDRIEKTHTTTFDPKFVTVQAAAKRTSLSEGSIRNLINTGKLTASRAVRGKIVIPIAAIDALMASSTAPSRLGRGRKPKPVVYWNDGTRPPGMHFDSYSNLTPPPAHEPTNEPPTPPQRLP
jgi:hypothetical protein